MRTFSSVIKVFNYVNFVVFMFTGRFTSLVERLLHMRLVYAQQNIPRFHSFEFLNRELVWQGFTEFMTFLMPLISFDKIRRFFNQKILRKSPRSLPETTCAFCAASPMTLPHITNCGHTYCYYCVKVALMQKPGLECPRCSARVTSLTRNDLIAP